LRRFRYRKLYQSIRGNRVTKFLAHKLWPRYLKKSRANARRLGCYTNFQKLWWTIFVSVRFWLGLKTRWALTPKWKKTKEYTGTSRWKAKSFYFNKFIRKKMWKKLRKRWIWHRLIKFSVKPYFLSNIKKYFAYNIAVRKYFDKILPYPQHQKIPFQQIPFFLVQNRLVPVIKRARQLCDAKRIVVNGSSVDKHYIMKPFDLLTFNFRKAGFWYKQRRYRNKRKRGTQWKLRKGFIYNRKMRMYILYKNIGYTTNHNKQAYWSYFYFHRNLLQGCHMR